jgi:MFS family permease
VLTPLIGRLGDIHGKERLLVIVLGTTAVGTLICALAASFPLLLAGRVVQGAAGGVFPLAFGIIRDEFPEAKVSMGIGMLSSLLGVGGGTGIVLSGVIVDSLNYHFLFWLPLPVMTLAAIAAWRFIPESPVRAKASINYVATGLLSVGLVCVLLGVSQASSWGWGSPKTLGLIAFGLLVLASWVRTEMRSEMPLVDMRMMRLRGVWTTNLTAFLLGWGMYEAFFLVPRLVQEPTSTGYGLGATVSQAGLMLLPSAVVGIVIGAYAGKLERRFGSKPPLVVGCFISVIAFGMYAVWHDATWQIYVASTVQGIGTSLAYAALPNLIVQAVSYDQTGVATGMNTIMRTLGGAIGSQVAASFVAAQLLASGDPKESGYTLALVTGGLVVAAGTIVALTIPGRRRPPQAELAWPGNAAVVGTEAARAG